MNYTLPQPAKKIFQNWASAEKVFTPEECQQIIAMGQEWQTGSVGDQDRPTVNGAVRSSDICWLPWGPDTGWIYDRIAAVSGDVNFQHFGFDLFGFFDALQLTRYTDAQQGHYSWHQDIGSGAASLRKLSLTLNLSDPDSYEGGNLEIFMQTHNKQRTLPRDQGSGIWFPSYEPHQVTTVTKGVRYSLVGWIGGPTFR
jgi:PKHD-type hydroxylase